MLEVKSSALRNALNPTAQQQGAARWQAYIAAAFVSVYA